MIHKIIKMSLNIFMVSMCQVIKLICLIFLLKYIRNVGKYILEYGEHIVRDG